MEADLEQVQAALSDSDRLWDTGTPDERRALVGRLVAGLRVTEAAGDPGVLLHCVLLRCRSAHREVANPTAHFAMGRLSPKAIPKPVLSPRPSSFPGSESSPCSSGHLE